MPRVRIEPSGVEIEVDFGAPLIEAFLLAMEKRPGLLAEEELFHDCECHGFVEVLEGEGKLHAMGQGEVIAMRERDIPLGEMPVRQLCQTLVLGDVRVRLLKHGRC